MLIQLTIENFKSISDPVILSLLASNEEEHSDYLYQFNNLKILPSVLLIGTNGAGKSNLFLAIKYLSNMLKNNEPAFYPNIKRTNESTKIDLQFIFHNKRYAYGVEILGSQVKSEYLYIINSDIDVIFEKENEIYQFKQDYEQTFRRLINESPKGLTLSVIRNTKIDAVNDAFYYLSSYLNVVLSVEELYPTAKRNFDFVKEQVNSHLRALKTDIVAFENSNDLITTRYENLTINIDDESTGVKKLFTLLVLLSEVKRDQKVVIIDELEKNFHQAITKYLIRMFNHSGLSQLLFSTHNTALLNLRLFRKDQIYFVEREKSSQSTVIYSLINFDDIDKEEDIERGYLYGRYGATTLEVKR